MGRRRHRLRSIWRSLLLITVGLLCCPAAASRSPRGGVPEAADIGALPRRWSHDLWHVDLWHVDGADSNALSRPRNAGGPPVVRAASCDPEDEQYAIQLRDSTPWRAGFIAINLYNNEAVLALMTAQLAALFDCLLIPAFGSAKALYVSVYSDRNTDRTPQLVHSTFKDMLKARGILHTLTATALGGGECGGLSKEAAGRIPYMACIRNEVLEPLRSGWFRDLDDGLLGSLGDVREDAAPVARQPLASTAVLFFNDIILQHPIRDIARLLLVDDGRFDLVCPIDAYVTFYDTWVARDVNGEPFSSFFPYSKVPTSQVAIAEQRPFRAKCCWDGLAVFPADVMWLQDGVHFPSRGRTAVLGRGDKGSPSSAPAGQWLLFRAAPLPRDSDPACFASECQYFCEDLLHYRRFASPGTAAEKAARIWIHPGVRVTYDASSHAYQLSALRRLFDGLTLWLQWDSWPRVVQWLGGASPVDHGMLASRYVRCVGETGHEWSHLLSRVLVLIWISLAGASMVVVIRQRLPRWRPGAVNRDAVRHLCGLLVATHRRCWRWRPGQTIVHTGGRAELGKAV